MRKFLLVALVLAVSFVVKAQDDDFGGWDNLVNTTESIAVLDSDAVLTPNYVLTPSINWTDHVVETPYVSYETTESINGIYTYDYGKEKERTKQLEIQAELLKEIMLLQEIKSEMLKEQLKYLLSDSWQDLSKSERIKSLSKFVEQLE